MAKSGAVTCGIENTSDDLLSFTITYYVLDTVPGKQCYETIKRNERDKLSTATISCNE